VDLIKKFFPFDEYRAHQRSNVAEMVKAFGSKKYDNIIYEAPVGSGKSVVAVTLANIMKECFYITAQKILMDQLSNDFGDQMAVLNQQKSNKYFSAADGTCIQKNKSFLKICQQKCACPYENALNKAVSEPQNIFNFSSFLFQREMADRFSDPKKLLIVDEAHNIESQIMDFVDVIISGEDIESTIPKFEEPEQYMRHFEQIDLDGFLTEKINSAKQELRMIVGDDESDFSGLGSEDEKLAKDLTKEAEKYASIRRKYNYLKSYVDKIECVADYNKEKNQVSIKPLYASYHTPFLLLNGGTNRLLMSGTILNHNLYCSNIGLDPDRTKFIRVPHTFPVSNRLVHLDYAGSMNFRSKNKTLPKLIKKIDKLMTKHKGEKGIIHCQSFWLMNDIIDGVSHDNKARLLNQKNFNNKDEMLAAHANSQDTVIIAPAMHEGLDLKDDLSRFQILCKVPYPSTRENKQLEKRVDRDWNYYLWLTAVKILQSVGRSIRSESDYAATYIIDSDFDKFFNMADKAGLMPDWFVESLVVD
jgi:Rad3-related DNA helicase